MSAAVRRQTVYMMAPILSVESMRQLIISFTYNIPLCIGLLKPKTILILGLSIIKATLKLCPEKLEVEFSDENILQVGKMPYGGEKAAFDQQVVVVVAAAVASSASVTTSHQLVLLEVQQTVFGMYDYGKLGNLAHYGQNTPPQYNLSLVTPPTALFWGENDYLADPQDVAKLIDELPNLVLNHDVEWPEFNHLDFIWARHAKELVYDYVLDFLAKYQ
ncbi:unnamed protein product, partial [Meganyctiphanes norvegica]